MQAGHSLSRIALAQATTTTPVGPNLSLGSDPASSSTNQPAQAEPHLARSFQDPNLMVAIFQEGRLADGGARDTGFAVSHDGGVTWKRGLVPHLTVSAGGGPFLRTSDPVAGVDPQGGIYLLSLGLTGSPPNFLGSEVISKSIDGGQTFSAPLTAFRSTDVNYFPDKPWMAINTFPGSSTAGRVVVTFTYFTMTNGNQAVQPIAGCYSDDGGTNWSAPRYLGAQYSQGSQPVFLPDGSLAVVYWHFTGTGRDQIELALSEDGGQTFGAPRLVTPVTLYADPVARAEGFLPSATADRLGGVLYVAYQALASVGSNDVPRIMFTRSIDRGLTWTAPIAVNDSPSGQAVFNPAIAVSAEGQHVTIIFYDKRLDDGSGNYVDLYLAESFDGGDSWGPNVRVSEKTSDLRLAPLTSAGRMVGDYQAIVPALDQSTPGLALWIDTRFGWPDPFVVSIPRTNGATFETWRRLRFSTNDLAQPSVSGPAADPDGNGVPNLLAYALGLAPGVGLPPLRAQTATDGGSSFVAASFEPLAVAMDVRFSWRGATNLPVSGPVLWSPVTPSAEHLGSGPRPGYQRVQTLFPLGGSPVMFFQLGVDSAAPPP